MRVLYLIAKKERDLSLHDKEGGQLLNAAFVPIDSLIADLEHMAKKAYYIGSKLAFIKFNKHLE